MDWRAVAVLVHVLAAFWFVAGYVATNVCTEIARRSASDEECRAALALSGRFDRWLNAPGGSAVAISGLLTLWVYGLPLTTPWVLASAILLVGVIGLGIGYWRRFGQAVGSAVSASDWPGVRRLLNEPRVVLVSRLENVAVLAILVLMILRPA